MCKACGKCVWVDNDCISQRAEITVYVLCMEYRSCYYWRMTETFLSLCDEHLDVIVVHYLRRPIEIFVYACLLLYYHPMEVIGTLSGDEILHRAWDSPDGLKVWK